MKRLKGPDVRLPELKIPSVLGDLYYDLVDRRLLPLVALVVVAILAVPFLLGGGSKELPVAPQEEIAGISATAESEISKLTVVEANPGLRDYRKRLATRKPTDPFRQRFAGPVRSDQLNKEVTTSTQSGLPTAPSTTVTSTSPTEPSLPATPTSPPESGGVPDRGDGDGNGGEPGLRLFTFAIDVKIVHTTTRANGRKDQSEPVTRETVVPPAALPSEKTQVVTYMGISPKTRFPLLLVSDDVTAVFGDAKCLSGSETCQLLEVEPGFPLTFVHGPNDARYKINVLKVEPVAAGDL